MIIVSLSGDGYVMLFAFVMAGFATPKIYMIGNPNPPMCINIGEVA